MATEIVFVLDRSGSMQGMEKDVIGGFNAFLAEQKVVKGKARLTTVLFDQNYEILHDGVDIKEVKPITDKEYFVRGTTALLDAVGKAITTAKAHTKPKDKVLVFINTDGFENSSREYTKEKLKALVKEREEKDGWKFVFIGAGIDAFAGGASIGIFNVANQTQSSNGYRSAYASVSEITAQYRASTSNNLDTTPLKKVE